LVKELKEDNQLREKLENEVKSIIKNTNQTLSEEDIIA